MEEDVPTWGCTYNLLAVRWTAPPSLSLPVWPCLRLSDQAAWTACSFPEERRLFVSKRTSVSLGKANLHLFFHELPRWQKPQSEGLRDSLGHRTLSGVCPENMKEESASQPSSFGEEILTAEFGKTKIKSWDSKNPHCCLSLNQLPR